MNPAELPESVFDPANFLDNPQINGFNRDKKQLFLEMYAKQPNFTAAAAAVGVVRQTVWLNLERDPEFKAAFEQVKEGLCDQLENKVHEYAQRPTNFLDRISYLRAYRPSRWNPQSQTQVNVNVRGLPGEKIEVLEGEIVQRAASLTPLNSQPLLTDVKAPEKIPHPDPSYSNNAPTADAPDKKAP